MQILEQHLDENGNISVRISDRCVVLTDDEAEQIKNKFNQINAENAKLRELVRIAVMYCDSGTCDECPIIGEDESCQYADMARELGVGVERMIVF